MKDFTITLTEIFKDESWIDLNVFFEKYEKFEEFPLISRYKKVSIIATSTGISGVANFLASTSFFVLNWVKLLAHDKKIDLNARFIAISFTDFDFSNFDEPPIPNFFVHSTETRAVFLSHLRSHETKTDSAELLSIKNLFTACNIEPAFSFYESRFYDKACNEELVRIFAVPHENFN
jgi:hypothetical protein